MRVNPEQFHKYHRPERAIKIDQASETGFNEVIQSVQHRLFDKFKRRTIEKIKPERFASPDQSDMVSQVLSYSSMQKIRHPQHGDLKRLNHGALQKSVFQGRDSQKSRQLPEINLNDLRMTSTANPINISGERMVMSATDRTQHPRTAGFGGTAHFNESSKEESLFPDRRSNDDQAIPPLPFTPISPTRDHREEQSVFDDQIQDSIIGLNTKIQNHQLEKLDQVHPYQTDRTFGYMKYYRMEKIKEKMSKAFVNKHTEEKEIKQKMLRTIFTMPSMVGDQLDQKGEV